METQLHRNHDDPHEKEERGAETRSAMKKVKEKVDKLKATIMHGDHKDEAQTVNDSPVVRSGLAEPTVMGTPVLAEDLYATHSDIVDAPVRPFAQWEDEERHGAPPPLSTDYEAHLTHSQPHVGQYGYGGDIDIDRDQFNFKGGIGEPIGLEEGYDAPLPPPSSPGYGTELAHVGHQTYGEDVNHREQLKAGSISNPASRLEEEERHGSPPATGSETPPTNLSHDHTINTGGKEVGITGVLQSFDKMKVFDEPETKFFESDQNDPKVYTGSHDQFAPEPVETQPLDTIAVNPSHPNSSYTQRISSATSAIAEKAAAVKDSIVSKLSSFNENKSEGSPVANKARTKSSFPTDLSHKVADTLSVTLGPVYEKVAGAGSSVMSKMQGSDYTAGSPKTEGKGVRVKEYLVETFKPGDDDKLLSDVIMHALHRGKGNQSRPPDTTTATTAYVVRDEGEGRLQDSSN